MAMGPGKRGDVVGKVFGWWTVIKEKPYTPYEIAKVFCGCRCGTTRWIGLSGLKRGKTKSCGCLTVERSSLQNYRGIGDLSKSYVTRIKSSAKSRGIEFVLTAEFLWELFVAQDGKCAITGVPLVMDRHFRKSMAAKNKNQTASLDRKDSSLGYVKGNVQWVHLDINMMKHNKSERRFVELCQAVAGHAANRGLNGEKTEWWKTISNSLCGNSVTISSSMPAQSQFVLDE